MMPKIIGYPPYISRSRRLMKICPDDVHVVMKSHWKVRDVSYFLISHIEASGGAFSFQRIKGALPPQVIYSYVSYFQSAHQCLPTFQYLRLNPFVVEIHKRSIIVSHKSNIMIYCFYIFSSYITDYCITGSRLLPTPSQICWV